jgi:hypothetical protein
MATIATMRARQSNGMRTDDTQRRESDLTKILES